MDNETNQQDQNQNSEPQQTPVTSEPTPSNMDGLEKFFDTYLREKAPFQIPAAGREFLVKYGPWISLVFLILGAIVIIPLTLLALGMTAAVTPYAMVAKQSLGTLAIVGIIISLVTLVMQGLAIPALLKRKMSGWKLVYYASLLSAAGSLLSGSIIGAILGILIGMYILFQIRSYYK